MKLQIYYGRSGGLLSLFNSKLHGALSNLFLLILCILKVEVALSNFFLLPYVPINIYIAAFNILIDGLCLTRKKVLCLCQENNHVLFIIESSSRPLVQALTNDNVTCLFDAIVHIINLRSIAKLTMYIACESLVLSLIHI